MFKGKVGLEGMFQTIMRKNTICDNGKGGFNKDIYENPPSINVSRANSEASSIDGHPRSVNTSLIDTFFDKLNKSPLHSLKSHVSQYSKRSEDKKLTSKKLKEASVKNTALKYNADMTIYEEYLHLLLIKTSDKFIRDRYKEHINFVNTGKEKKQNFFQRMKQDIIVREETKRGRDDALSETSSVFKLNPRKLTRKRTPIISEAISEGTDDY